MAKNSKKRVFSGIQPSGSLHIGNYLGALQQWVAMQDEYDCFYCVVDLHAITLPQDPAELRAGTRAAAGIYLAAGLDPETATIFVQSHVRAHSELAWILSCFSPLGWLQRMTQFKDKSAKQLQESIGAGLLNYPTLMAADILLYQTHAVPVGDDQRQHLEYTRDLAQRFNHLYGEVFTVPEAIIPKAGARIMGLDNPTAKMSKSEDSEYHAIYLLEDLDKTRKKIMRSVTDSGKEIMFSSDPEKAGVTNLLTIYQAFTRKANSDIEAEFEGRGYGDLKKVVAEVVVERLRPLQARYNELAGEEGYLDDVLAQGAERAASIAEKTLKQVQGCVGFLPPR
jgi:tryptophanyl-tRNA synthetase